MNRVSPFETVTDYFLKPLAHLTIHLPADTLRISETNVKCPQCPYQSLD